MRNSNQTQIIKDEIFKNIIRVKTIVNNKVDMWKRYIKVKRPEGYNRYNIERNKPKEAIKNTKETVLKTATQETIFQYLKKTGKKRTTKTKFPRTKNK